MMKKRKYSTKRRQLLPDLPLDVIPEILCRLPVKLLLQLRCVCKSWKSLISDTKFANKHLHMSKTSKHNHRLIINSPTILSNLNMKDYPIPSVFLGLWFTYDVVETKLSFPDILNNVRKIHLRVCSCDGILCYSTDLGTIDGHSVVLWNPSIRKFNVFPPLENQDEELFCCSFSFGYDHFAHTYKIVAVSFFEKEKINQVNVYTLGTNSWRRIQDLPYSQSISEPGVFANGTINWLTRDALGRHIVSLDLEKESYRKISKPNLETNCWRLGVLRDCLCIFATTNCASLGVEIWIMKKYENEESWTKLFHVSYDWRDYSLYHYDSALYISEDDQVLMYYETPLMMKFNVYDSKSHTFNKPTLPAIDRFLLPQVYVESLISPCS